MSRRKTRPKDRRNKPRWLPSDAVEIRFHVPLETWQLMEQRWGPGREPTISAAARILIRSARSPNPLTPRQLAAAIKGDPDNPPAAPVLDASAAEAAAEAPQPDKARFSLPWPVARRYHESAQQTLQRRLEPNTSPFAPPYDRDPDDD